MNQNLYTACVGDSRRIAESVSYDVLITRIIEYTLRAAVAHSVDRPDWEQDELRRRGLGAIQLFRDGKALWADRKAFEAELAEAQRECIEDRFKDTNAMDPALYERLDRDLRARWRLAGYQSPTLRNTMRALFVELERDICDRESRARAVFIAEIAREIS